MHTIHVAIAVVLRQKKILICQRKTEGSLGGFWEFPGGKREPNETLHDCLHRELMEEVAIDAKIVGEFTPIQHDYDRTRVILHPYLCEHTTGEARPIACQRCEWIGVEQLGDFQFPPANESLLIEIAAKVNGLP